MVHEIRDFVEKNAQQNYDLTVHQFLPPPPPRPPSIAKLLLCCIIFSHPKHNNEIVFHPHLIEQNHDSVRSNIHVEI